MGNDYRSMPTAALLEMWMEGVGALKGRDPSDLDVGDFDAVYDMRRELDRRKDEPKQVVDVNFSKDYLTD